MAEGINIAAEHVPQILQRANGFAWVCSCGNGMPDHFGWETIHQAAQSWGAHLDKVAQDSGNG